MIERSTSARLRSLVALSDQALRAALDSLWNHPRIAELYPHMLFSAYSVMRGTVPAMERALNRARQEASASSACAAIAAYLEKHIPEERGHDKWVLDDLEALGFSRHAVVNRLPTPACAALVGAQYYWIDHVDPVAVLGYIAVIEGDPPAEREIRDIIPRLGLPAAGFSNMLRHAALDPRHQAEFDVAMDAMELSDREWNIVGVSAIQTAGLYTRLVEETADQV